MPNSFVTVKKSSLKNGNPGRPNPKSSYVILFKATDLATKPVIGADGITVASALQFKTGASAIEIYAIPGTIKPSEKSSGDPDKRGFIQSLEFEHPGGSLEISAFSNNFVNEGFMAIVVYPDLAYDKLLGWPGNPLSLNIETKDDEKEETNTLKFESIFAGNATLHYTCASYPKTDQNSGSGLGFPYNKAKA